MRAQKAILTVLFAFGALTLTSCKSKPDSSVYLGNWTVAAMGGMGGITTCPIVITKTDVPNVGERVMVKQDPTFGGNICEVYNGVYTITPEGALTRESTQPFQLTVRFVFDKDKNTVSVLTDQVGLQPMARR